MGRSGNSLIHPAQSAQHSRAGDHQDEEQVQHHGYQHQAGRQHGPEFRFLRRLACAADVAGGAFAVYLRGINNRNNAQRQAAEQRGQDCPDPVSYTHLDVYKRQVIALVLGHVAPALVTSARQFTWFGHWLQWLGTQSGEGGFWRGRHGIVLALLPVLAGVALLQWLLHAPLLGFLGLLFGVVALVYAWGPRDLDVDVEAIIDAHDAPTRREAIARLLSLIHI